MMLLDRFLLDRFLLSCGDILTLKAALISSSHVSFFIVISSFSLDTTIKQHCYNPRINYLWFLDSCTSRSWMAQISLDVHLRFSILVIKC
jgi:hypothetical protein